MSGFFGFLALVFFVMMIVGLINPKLFKNKKTEVIPKRLQLFGVFGGLFFVLIIISAVLAPSPSTNNNGSTSITENTTASEEPKKEKVKEYKTGTYLVGKDIESGLYKVSVKDSSLNMGYVERAKDVSMDMNSIIANIILTGDGYVEILDTDVAVKITGAKLTKISLDQLSKNPQKEVSDGIHLVGYDINPGTYKVEVTDEASGIAYVERSKRVSMGSEDIIANDIFQGPGYVKVKEGDFAIRVQGAKLTLQE